MTGFHLISVENGVKANKQNQSYDLMTKVFTTRLPGTRSARGKPRQRAGPDHGDGELGRRDRAAGRAVRHM